MDIFSTAHKPLEQFAVVGMLLIGLQHGYSTYTTDVDLPRSEPVLATVAAPAPPGPVGRIPSSLSGAKPALINFTATAKAKQSTYRFSSKLKRPFALASKDDLSLATWQISKQFSFVGNQFEVAKNTLLNRDMPFVIMIDPGHGGTDPGSVGHNGLEEKVLTLDIAKRAQRILSEDDDISVLLTRETDRGMSRLNRVQRVKHSNADMVVSLHLNHLPQTEINLVETYYAAPHNIRESIDLQRSKQNSDGMIKTTANHNHDFSFTKGSKRLASLMQKHVFEEVNEHNPITDNAGVKQETLFILTRSFRPGVLIELSCLSNVDEAERLDDPAYREKLAEALASGIRDYLATPAAQQQFGPEV